MESIIAQFFSQTERHELERGTVDLEAINPSLVVPFLAKRLDDARVAWLNVRWFLQRGIHVIDPMVRQRVETWLIEEFGYAIVGDPGAWSEKATKTFYAERYGSTEGTTPHGGAGRSGIAGQFCAKGLGPTPLVGMNAAPGHTHGSATLEECLREAIYAEVIDAEFPFGAVPTIAVLDAGLDFTDPDAVEPSRRKVRRGILIRPCVLRLAHIERAPLFRDPRASHEQHRQHQQDDVKRTRATVEYWLGQDCVEGVVPPEQLIERLAQQLSFSHVHRLSPGGLFSSNLSLTGALLDFGNAHALPDWSRAMLLEHAAGFGDEMSTLNTICRSMAFYLTKYGYTGTQSEWESKLRSVSNLAYTRAFEHECLALFNAPPSAPMSSMLSAELGAYYRQQQRCRVSYQHGRVVADRMSANATPWLGDLLKVAGANWPSDDSQLLTRMRAHLRHMGGSIASDNADQWVDAAIVSAGRRLSTRPKLDRGDLIDRLSTMVWRIVGTKGAVAHWVEEELDGVVGAGRTHWKHLSSEWMVCAQRSFGASTVLLCEHMSRGIRAHWCEGPRFSDRRYLFNEVMDGERIGGLDLCEPPGLWSAWFPLNGPSPIHLHDGYWTEHNV